MDVARLRALTQLVMPGNPGTTPFVEMDVARLRALTQPAPLPSELLLRVEMNMT